MSHAPSEHLKERLRLVRHALAARTLDALIVTSMPNVRYLTNFRGSSAIAVVAGDRLLFLTDSRYVTAVSAMRETPFECPGLELVVVEGAYDTTLAEVLRTMASAQVGFEASHLTVARHDWLLKTLAGGPAPALAAVDGVVERSRVRKDSYELDVLRKAGRLLSSVAREVFTIVTRGRTERDVALDIDWRIRSAGFERSAFETIVASGPNAALPHARPTERTLSEGDLVVLDFGGVYDSYCVDLTRTVSVGPASVRAREVHSAVLRAHDRAIASCAPGQSRFAIDGEARRALAEAGMAEAFGHGTGHGLGLEVHEDPRITRRLGERGGADADEAVLAGMVFTIEPGAYFPGWGGVRIEDDVAITEDGVELLTEVTTELIEV
jgi:Xaa-Pro aminopeptidase